MNITNEQIHFFKRLFFTGIDQHGKICTQAVNSVKNSSSKMGLSEEEGEAVLSYIQEVAEAKNKGDIMTLAGISNASDVDVLDFFIRAKNVNPLDFVDDDGEWDIDLLRDSEYGDLVTSYKLSSKGEVEIKFADKIEAIKQIQEIKADASARSKGERKIKAISFFDDKIIDTAKIQEELDELKKL